MALKINKQLTRKDGSTVPKSVCVQSLLSMPEGENLSGQEKADCYQLSMKIHKAKDKIDLKLDEMKKLKDLIGKTHAPYNCWSGI